MRTEKLSELRGYIEQLGIKKRDLLDANSRFIKVERYICELNNGHIVRREKVVKNGSDGSAAIILPITDEGNTLLVVQPRVFTASGVGVELPAGYLDEGEDYEAAAKRELFEETGYVSESMTLLAQYYQDQGCSAAFNKSFLAEGCRKVGQQHLDGDEFIKYFECTFDEALELVDMGLIADANSQFAIERARQYLKK